MSLKAITTKGGALVKEGLLTESCFKEILGQIAADCDQQIDAEATKYLANVELVVPG